MGIGNSPPPSALDFFGAKSMEEELEEKGRIIEELQEDLIKSATLGKGLLDRNNELEQQLKEQEDLYTEKIDV